MKISLIVAMDRNGIIGQDYTLPWRLSSDLKYFKAVTMGKPIVMGRKTHESIGRPLPGRDNVVLSRETDYQAEGCTVLNSLEDFYKQYADAGEVMIMGGADLYEQTLDKATRIYLTKVHAEVEGDTWFPKMDWDIWEEVGRQDFKADARNEYDYSFVILERNNA
ncbi:MAG: type 3 dihydrofolate reductase [Gammaproteobacteria bacterium]|nr:type 3 dihydrofolate reductase [Gammaproteobacteria bacterium]NIN62168.1 type 3 dihydrofolate reductase [Gammaproteobacteria bacterium]NIO61906.1 type 3 dihydrofolate reductase [Gammaproteobacteria bacterium]NIP49060.1 type 3 dihydrofolate reductase [Gammaproteobacteria bacterium]NIQ09516.1 type 3 dihydrofolate reductase [Gammaproteobacteria bacterium]